MNTGPATIGKMGFCAVCGRTPAADMTDGRTHADLCDGCRELTVVLFHILGSLAAAVEQARQAKTGRPQ